VSATPPTRAVLLDLDDTLVDHRYAIHTTLKALRDADARLRALELDFFIAEWNRVLDAMYEDVVLGRISIHESRIRRYHHFYELAGSPIAAEEALAVADRHVALYMANRRVVPGADLLLAALKSHVPIAIVTNSSLREQTEKLATFQLDRHVDVLVTSEEFGAAKPDASIFHHALAQLGVDARDAVMVGDSWENDVVGAAGVGMRAVWLNRTGIPCPDPALAHELSGYEPIADVVDLLLNRCARDA
jgi:putative hydrolase of the HAD superfamily